MKNFGPNKATNKEQQQSNNLEEVNPSKHRQRRKNQY